MTTECRIVTDTVPPVSNIRRSRVWLYWLIQFQNNKADSIWKLKVWNHAASVWKLKVWNHTASVRKLKVWNHTASVWKLKVWNHTASVRKLKVWNHTASVWKLDVWNHTASVWKLKVWNHTASVWKLKVWNHTESDTQPPQSTHWDWVAAGIHSVLGATHDLTVELLPPEAAGQSNRERRVCTYIL